MREKQIREQIERELKALLIDSYGIVHSADEYYYGWRDGTDFLVKWLIQQGVIKRGK